MLGPLRIFNSTKCALTRNSSSFVSRMRCIYSHRPTDLWWLVNILLTDCLLRYMNHLKEDDTGCAAALERGLVFLFHSLSPFLRRTERGTFRPPALNVPGTRATYVDQRTCWESVDQLTQSPCSRCTGSSGETRCRQISGQGFSSDWLLWAEPGSVLFRCWWADQDLTNLTKELPLSGCLNDCLVFPCRRTGSGSTRRRMSRKLHGTPKVVFPVVWSRSASCGQG